MTKDSNDNIETIEAEEINPSDSFLTRIFRSEKVGDPRKQTRIFSVIFRTTSSLSPMT